MSSRHIQGPKAELLEPRLLMSSSPLAEALASSELIDLPAAGAVSLDDALAGDEGNVYHFTTTARTLLTIHMASPESGVDSYLTLFNAAGRRIRVNDNAARGTLDSQIRLWAQPGQTFYVMATGSDETLGAFTLDVGSSPVDDYGNDVDAARLLRLNRLGSGRLAGWINYSGDVDLRSFVATKTGLMRMALTAPGRSNALQGSLVAYDSEGQIVATSQNDAVSFDVVEGQTYYLEIAGEVDTTGLYRVGILPTLAPMLAAAPLADLPTPGSVSVTGSLAADQSVAYKFTTGGRGLHTIELAAGEGDLDTYLEVYDDNGRLRYRNDNASRQTTDSRIRLYLQAGQNYYVVASGVGGTAGQYDLTLTSNPIDDYGNDTDQARALRMNRLGAARLAGRINYGGDVDLVEFVAQKTGLMRAVLTSYGRGDFQGEMVLLDDQGQLVEASEADPSGYDVLRGQTYFLRFTGAGEDTGLYRASLLTTLEPILAAAPTVDVPNGGQAVEAGSLGAGEVAAYEFTAGASGFFTVGLTATGGDLDPYLRIYDSNGRLRYRNDNASRQTTDSAARLYVRPGQTYYAVASGVGTTAGSFELTMTSRPFDDCGNDFDDARALRLNAAGAGYLVGRINYAGDVDVRQFVAQKTGQMRMVLTAYGRGTDLDPEASLFDADHELLAESEPDGTLSLDIVKGQTYYLQIAGADETAGFYRASILTTLEPLLAAAPTVETPAAEAVTVSGDLSAGALAAYRFTTPARGIFTLDLTAAGGDLDPYLRLYDSYGRLRYRNDNASRATLDSSLRLYVGAGQTYIVVASGGDETSGAYELTLTSQPIDDYGNTRAAAAAVALSRTGFRRLGGVVNYSGDVDVLQVTATMTGTMQVDMSPVLYRSSVACDLIAYDGAGNVIAEVDSYDGNDAGVEFDVTEGQVYYLQAASRDDGIGYYLVEINTVEKVVPPPAPPPDAPEPGATIVAQTYTLPSGLQLVIAGTDGADTISLSQTAGSILLTTAGGTQTISGAFTSVVVYGFGADDAIRLGHSVTATSWVYAGSGDDAVFEAGAGEAAIYGGLGDDLLVAVGGGADAVYGEAGLDSFWVDSTDTVADSSAAETGARSVHQIAAFYQPYSSSASHPDYVSLEIAGQNFRDPTTTSSAAGYANFADRSLFVDGAEYNDIRQGSIGDCYYLASLASMADTDPGLIEQMIAPLGDGTYAVRFYQNGQEVYLRLDADLPVSGGGSIVYARFSPDGETWVPLLEKAYAYFRTGGNSYSSIHGGWMGPVFEHMTGLGTSSRWTFGDSAGLASFLADTLAAGHAVTLGSYYSASSPIVSSHAYMVKEVETTGEGTYVTVYNPWGVDGRSWDSNYSDGKLRITIDQVQENFSAVVASLA